MLDFKKALEKCEEITTNDNVLDNPFSCIESLGYLKAIIDIYHEELSDSGTLGMVKTINSIILARSVQLMTREMKGEEKSE